MPKWKIVCLVGMLALSFLCSEGCKKVGSLQVNLLPPEAMSAGAQWAVDESEWHASGATVSDLSEGVHTVTFKDIAGWTAPEPQDVQIVADETQVITATYVVGGEGEGEGGEEGQEEGLIEGEGVEEGQEEGMIEGEGSEEGQEEGVLEGIAEGETEGQAEGVTEGSEEGQIEGEGVEEGETEGVIEGEGEGEGEPISNVYYVAPSGNDDWAGTFSNPWKTVTHAAEMASAGNTIYLREGTYYERLIPANSGTAGHYITFSSYTGETATLDGTGVDVPEDTGLIDLTGLSFISIQGLRIQNVGTTNLSAGLRAEYASNLKIENNHTYDTASSGIGIWACSNVVVGGNEVELACNNWGMQENITMSGTSHFEIAGNHVHTGSAETIGGEGICIKDGASNGTVHNNLVHDIIDNPGIYLDAWAHYTFGIDIYNNVVYDIAASNGSGFAMASENGGLLENIRMFNNIAYNCAYNGLTFGYYGDPSDSRPIHDVQVINNTFYYNGWTSWGGGVAMDNPDAQGIVFRNNIFSDNNAFQLVVSVALAEVTTDHNLIDGFREFENEIRGTNYQEGSPEFLNAAASDFHVQSGSPAIDNGSAAGAPADDIEGTARPQGSGYDIGAYER
ncbi:MAG TPA: right-handed parallel beta-helix repeat-containing protein [Candidatus Hydrogenedentes bacterium]|nr:right-handed parallel beta-helix repeat-containing protein [Candidatus Hydrogenedentota bacterium]